MEQRFAPIFVNLKSNTYENHDVKVAIVNQFSKLNNKKFFIKNKKEATLARVGLLNITTSLND